MYEVRYDLVRDADHHRLLVIVRQLCYWHRLLTYCVQYVSSVLSHNCHVIQTVGAIGAQSQGLANIYKTYAKMKDDFFLTETLI
jgi:hypothetical protein